MPGRRHDCQAVAVDTAFTRTPAFSCASNLELAHRVLSPRGTMLIQKRFLALALPALALFSSCPAAAQSVSLASQPFRALYQNGAYVDATNSPRPPNQHPTGANFSDCEDDLKLTFPLVIAGFSTDDVGLEAWAGPGNCSDDAARGVGGVPTCWRVGPSATPLLAVDPFGIPMDVYGRDVLRYENAAACRRKASPHIDESFHRSPDGSEGACHVQATDAAVMLGIWFIPIQIASGTATGTAFEFALRDGSARAASTERRLSVDRRLAADRELDAPEPR